MSNSRHRKSKGPVPPLSSQKRNRKYRHPSLAQLEWERKRKEAEERHWREQEDHHQPKP